MDRRSVLLIAVTLAGCGGEGGAGGGAAAPCVPLDAGKPVGPDAGAQAFLDAHNLVRSGCGVTISPAPSPPLPLLQWSTAAAGVAQAWAEGCVYAHNAGILNGTIRLGENIAASSGSLSEGAAVGLWASEWSNYSYSSNSCGAGKVCGHYTQLLWRDTLRVGCATAHCSSGSPFGSGNWTFVVCDYDPPGNFRGQKPY